MKSYCKHIFVLLTICAVLFVNMAVARATTMLDIRAAVRKYIANNLGSYQSILNSQIDAAINQAHVYILDVLPVSANQNFIQTYTIPISNGVASYALPSNFRRLISLSYRNSPAIQIKPEEFYGRVSRATSLDPMFMISNNLFRLYPTPITGNTAEVMFMAQPNALTTEVSVLSTLPEFDNLITVSSVYFLTLMTGNANYSALAKETMNALITSKSVYFNTNVSEVKK